MNFRLIFPIMLIAFGMAVTHYSNVNRGTFISYKSHACAVVSGLQLNTPKLTENALCRSYHEGNSCRLNNVFRRLEMKKNVTIVFMGGSMTAGHGCTLQQRDSFTFDKLPSACSWPEMFGTWLKNTFPLWNVTVKNIAIGGFSSSLWRTRKEMFKMDADIVVLDFCVNSVYDPDELVKTSIGNIILNFQSKGIAVISMETFDTCGTNELEYCRKICSGPIGNISGYYWCENLRRVQDVDYESLSSYDVTFSSYRDAVWPMAMHPPDDLSMYWSHLRHPNSTAHALVARVFEYTFTRELKSYCAKPVEQKCEKTRAHGYKPFYCAEVGNFTEFTPTHVGSSWVPNKIGWINTSNNSTEDIIFEAKFPDRRQLEVTHMKTNKFAGVVHMWIKCEGSNWIKVDELTNVWKKTISIPYVSTYASSDKSKKHYKVIPIKSKCLIRFRMLPEKNKENKFKLLSVNGC